MLTLGDIEWFEGGAFVDGYLDIDIVVNDGEGV